MTGFTQPVGRNKPAHCAATEKEYSDVNEEYVNLFNNFEHGKKSPSIPLS